MGKIPLIVGVPTTTIIIAKSTDPFSVVVLRSAGKHGNKLILPGGRVKIGHENWLQTGITESMEEVTIEDLTDIAFFCLASKPGRDIRHNVKLEKFLDDNPEPDGVSRDVQIESHHSFDVVITARSESEPVPDGTEGKEAFYLDVRTMDVNDFAMDHGHILQAYHEYLVTGKLPALDQF